MFVSHVVDCPRKGYTGWDIGRPTVTIWQDGVCWAVRGMFGIFVN